MFVAEPDLFRASLEARIEKTPEEIEGLVTIFNEYGVPDGGLVLDLACGIGRVSVPLAKLGYTVVGVDLSPSYIGFAKDYAEREGVSDRTRFIVGDMREVEKVLSEYLEAFDIVINMWTSMGYWDEETDLRILRQCLSLTKASGFFLMHTANRDNLVRRFQAHDFSISDDGIVMLMERELDLETSRMINFWSYYRKEGEDLRFLDRLEVNHRIYSLHELKEQFIDAGWRFIAVYGGLNQRKLTIDTFSMVLVAQK
ncbi:MAG: class I SAM-dependent methyltransferase [Candidatus Bathyarchaeota archaeon]|nr:class I SAM-dependent methyltransferase [Candidatus Bathyarchaeota archaeon]